MGLRHFSCLKFRFKAVLRAVRLIGDHHNVLPVRQHRKTVFVLPRHELLDGGKHDAARRPVRQQRAQLLPRAGLHRLLTQQVLRQAEHAEELAVKVIAVGDDHDGRVGHRGLLHHTRGETRHGDALAAALRVPHHAALALHAAGRTGPRRRHHLRDGRAHRMELVVARDLLHQRAVILEQHEVAQVVEQVGRCQHAAHQRLQLVELAQRVERDAVDGAPRHEAFAIGRERAHQRLGAVGDDQQRVVLKNVGNLRLVRLQLVVCLPDVGILVGRVLDL